MTNNESGRSMVEMLGVLAIIGVLSVGGIAGYTMAMNKHKANNLVDCIAKMSIAAQVSTTATAPTQTDYCAVTDVGNWDITATATTGAISLTAGTNASAAACKAAKDAMGNKVGSNGPTITWPTTGCS
ncbi:MAG: hypothetical protein II938_02150 [Alphaproteobacteria bacterium]|nr:hypothetical protein [Alphaproteobacteria bacterium]